MPLVSAPNFHEIQIKGGKTEEIEVDVSMLLH